MDTVYRMATKMRAGDLITHKFLQLTGACAQQLGLFKSVYPKGVKLNTYNLNTARSKHRLSTMYLIFRIAKHSELQRMYKLAGVNKHKERWTAADARKIHPAFIKVLKERK